MFEKDARDEWISQAGVMILFQGFHCNAIWKATIAPNFKSVVINRNANSTPCESIISMANGIHEGFPKSEYRK